MAELEPKRKLSDVFLGLLGDTLLGAGGASPIEYRKQLETQQLARDLADSRRLAALAALSRQGQTKSARPLGFFQGKVLAYDPNAQGLTYLPLPGETAPTAPPQTPSLQGLTDQAIVPTTAGVGGTTSLQDLSVSPKDVTSIVSEEPSVSEFQTFGAPSAEKRRQASLLNVRQMQATKLREKSQEEVDKINEGYDLLRQMTEIHSQVAGKGGKGVGPVVGRGKEFIASVGKGKYFPEAAKLQRLRKSLLAMVRGITGDDARFSETDAQRLEMLMPDAGTPTNVVQGNLTEARKILQRKASRVKNRADQSVQSLLSGGRVQPISTSYESFQFGGDESAGGDLSDLEIMQQLSELQ